MDLKNEKKILKKAVSGNEESFALIYDAYVNNIYKFVYLKVNSKESAEEIVQDVFLRFWRYANRKQNEVKSIKPLLYATARNLIIDYYRSSGRDDILVDIDDIQLSPSMSDIDKYEHIDTEYDMKEVKVALGSLPAVYQDIIIMKYIEDLTNKEIAKILNKKIGNIRVLAHRALNHLKKVILTNRHAK